jgi:ornithine carbamoyltransferase
MSANLQGRHFLSVLDFSTNEIQSVLDTAVKLRHDGYSLDNPPLRGRTLGMIFQKPSLRTRVSFETGMTKLGGHAIYLAPTDISLGKRETTEDIALVLSRYVDMIMARVFGHEIVADLAKHATVPVINGLSDFEHPCQILADLQTVLERKGRLAGLRLCYIGDGNNVAHSLMYGAVRMGMRVTIICPEGYEPTEQVTANSRAVAAAGGKGGGQSKGTGGDTDTSRAGRRAVAADQSRDRQGVVAADQSRDRKEVVAADQSRDREGAVTSRERERADTAHSAVAHGAAVEVTVTSDLEAAAGADILYTDVWASMGQEAEAAARKKAFAAYRIDAETMMRADPDAMILHCLPAHYGDEIDYATSRLPNSAIFDQAENRMHAQNALMLHLAGAV